MARLRGPKILRSMSLAGLVSVNVHRDAVGGILTVWARTWDDEPLERGEGKVSCAGGEERLRRWDEVLVANKTEKTFLFTFLTNDRCDTTSQSVVISVGKELNDILKSSENQIGESCSEGNSVLEIRCWEHILAWQNRFVTKMLESPLCVECVQFLLRQYGGQRIDNDTAFLGIVNLKP